MSLSTLRRTRILGVSVLEVMFAMTIFLGVAATFAGVIPTALRMQRKTNAQNNVANFATGVLNEVKSLGFPARQGGLPQGIPALLGAAPGLGMTDAGINEQVAVEFTVNSPELEEVFERVHMPDSVDPDSIEVHIIGYTDAIGMFGIARVKVLFNYIPVSTSSTASTVSSAEFSVEGTASKAIVGAGV